MSFNLTTNGFLKIGSVVINCHSCNYNPGQTSTPAAAAGDVLPHSHSFLQAEPTFSFSTYEIDKALTATGLLATSNTLAEVYFQHTAQQGVRNSTHTLLTVAKGMFVPVSITASQGGLAEMSFELHAVSTDGTTNPVTQNVAASLPAYAPILAKDTLGPVSVNGTQITGVQSWSLTFNGDVQKNTSDGNVYPVVASLLSQAPTLTVTTNNVIQAQTLAINTLCDEVVFQLLEAACTIDDPSHTFTAATSLIRYSGRTGSQGQVTSADLTLDLSAQTTREVAIVHT